MTREPGDRIIPKLIPLIRDTIVATKRALGPHDQRVRRDAMQEVIDRAGREAASLYRPIIEAALASHGDNIHPLLEQHAHKMKSGEHQWEALLANAGFTAVGLFGSAINNLLAVPIYEMNRSNPHLQADPQTMATAAVSGLASFNDVVDAAANLGYNHQAANLYYQLALRVPDFGTLVQLNQHGLIGNGELESWLHRSGVPSELRGPLMHLTRTLISPADAALAVLRGNMPHSDGVAVAQKWGYTADDFEVMIGNTGEPPGVMDMLAMLRRGIIDESRLKHGILQSRMRNEWVPFVEQMRYSPMTTADAIAASVQTHISEDKARQIASMNGLRPEDFQPLADTYGEPLSKQEVLRLHRMGKMTADEVRQALRESRLKNKYIEHALELGAVVPPITIVKSMLTSGAIDDTQARKYISELGYDDRVVTALLKDARKTKVQKQHDLSQSMLVGLYEEKHITGDQLIQRLQHLGYSQDESREIRTLVDDRIVAADRASAVSHVRALFLGHKITDADAQNKLHALLISADAVEKLITDWRLERVAVVRQLTPAQIIAAWKLDLIDAAQALGRLVNLGYSGPDAGLLLEIANKGPLPAGA
jgi:hypothetical protein